MNCKTCKYWKDIKYIELENDYKICTLISNITDSPDNELAWAGSWSEMIGAELMTKAGFGCILYESIHTNLPWNKLNERPKPNQTS